MKLKKVLIFIVLIIVNFVIFMPKQVNANSDIIVALDPGHGGNDPGAEAGGIKEKDVNWKIANKVKEILDKTPGIRGVIIRSYDENPSLADRATRAKNNNANLYVSFHINSNNTNIVRGSEVYVTAYKGEDRYNKYCTNLAYSVLANLRNVGVPSRLYTPIIKYSEESSRIYSDGSRADWMGMIRNPVYNGIPAILIEHCYINNIFDRQNFLTSDSKINKMAEADAKSIIENKELFRTIDYTKKFLGGTKDSKAMISYLAQLQNIGWTGWGEDGETIGTTGGNLRLETVKISLADELKSEKLQYRVHVQDIGWMDWVQDGQLAGTVGKSKRVEAIQIKLKDSEKYNVQYRVHVQDIGWTNWTQNGQIAGTTGKSKRIEAIQIKLESKTSTDSEEKTNNKQEQQGINISYKTHIQDKGWENWVSNGKTAGTTGKAKRLEAIQIKLDGVDSSIKDAIQYKVHVQDIGWMNWISDGKTAGTTGKSKRIEAIQIKLNSSLKKNIKYRVHVQDIGWTNWKKNGEIAGTTGKSKRIEAIEIQIE